MRTTPSRPRALAAALLILTGSAGALAADSLPRSREVPGGIAIVAVPAADTIVTVADRRQPVVATAGGFRAIVGIPLNAGPELALRIGGRDTTLTLGEAGYREQHLTIERRDYVNPSAEQLARYRRERTALDEAIARFGAGPASPFAWPAPVPGRRSNTFGARRFFNGEARRPHSGMDIAAPTGTPIRTPAGGHVTLVDALFFNGNTVVVDHGNGIVSLYCHLATTAVEAGDDVASGEVLGTVGATGRVTGPHLHFSVFVGGTAVDPALVLAPP